MADHDLGKPNGGLSAQQLESFERIKVQLRFMNDLITDVTESIEQLIFDQSGEDKQEQNITLEK